MLKRNKFDKINKVLELDLKRLKSPNLESSEYENLKNKYESDLFIYNLIFGIDTKTFLSTIIRILNKQEDKYTIIEDCECYFIKSIDDSVSIKFANKGHINIQEDILKSNHALILTFPSLKPLLTFFVYFCANRRYSEDFEELKSALEKYQDIQLMDFLNQISELLYNPNNNVNDKLINTTLELIEASIFNNNREFKSDITKSDIDSTIKNLISGYYNPLAVDYLTLEKDTLVSWDRDRQKYNIVTLPTTISYMVYSCFNKIAKQVDYLDINDYYLLQSLGQKQSKATTPEKDALNSLREKILKRKYNWQEVQEIKRRVKNLDIYHSFSFPHNIAEIINCFNVYIESLYDQLEYDLLLEQDTSKLREIANVYTEKLQKGKLHLDKEVIPNIFSCESESYIDEYVRRMILSIISFSMAIEDKENLSRIQAELIKGTRLSEETLSKIFSNKENSKEIEDLTYGGLLSLLTPKGKLNIKDTVNKIQSELSCNEGTINAFYKNEIKLPDGTIIASANYHDIDSIFDDYQAIYDYAYDNASDLEFVEDCTGIFASLLIDQIFIKGNKRTAKCLLNKMLLSRGIIPPITDINENEFELFDEIALSVNNHFDRVRYKLLLQSVDVAYKFRNGYFSEPLHYVEDEKLRIKRYAK